MTHTPAQRAAALLGSRGGRANTQAQQAARRRNGLLGGQPPRYRLVMGDEDDVLHRRHGDDWLTLLPPYDRAARAALRRLRGED